MDMNEVEAIEGRMYEPLSVKARRLRDARLRAGHSIEAAATDAGVDVEVLRLFELGCCPLNTRDGLSLTYQYNLEPMAVLGASAAPAMMDFERLLCVAGLPEKGAIFRKIREYRGDKVSWLAGLLGIPRGHIEAFEAGQAALDAVEVRLLAGFYGLPAELLRGGSVARRPAA